MSSRASVDSHHVAVHDPRPLERPTLIERARFTPPPTPVEAALLDEGIHSGAAPVGVIERAYGIGNWSQLTVTGVPHGR